MDGTNVECKTYKLTKHTKTTAWSFKYFIYFLVMTADRVQLLHDFWKIVGRNERLAEDTFHKTASINLFFFKKLWHQSVN